MKVLNVYRTYYPDPPGGLQEAIRQICLSTTALNVENTIYSLSPKPIPNRINYPEASVVRTRSWITPASCDIGGIASLVSFRQLSNQSDLNHYFFPWPFADVLHATINSQKPTIMTYISDVVRQRVLGSIYAPLMWKTLRKMDLIVANCPAYIETSPVLSHPSIRNKVKIIPLGINESTYFTLGDDSILNKLGITPTEPYFLFLGVLRYYKGLHTLINAAKSVDAKIIIAGSGPKFLSLMKQATELGLNNVFFTGQVSDSEKTSLIKNCVALILPSHLRSEAYGMVLVEAAMMSKPMISCEIGTGTSYINLHEKTGLVVEPENVSQMANAMRTLLSDASLTLKMSMNARLRYEENFSGEALGKAYSDAYKEVLGRK